MCEHQGKLKRKMTNLFDQYQSVVTRNNFTKLQFQFPGLNIIIL